MNFQENVLWENNHFNVQCRASRLYDAWSVPPGAPNDFTSQWQGAVNGLKVIIKDAETNNKCVRAVGGGWSLSEAALTNDYLINTMPMNMIKVHFDASHVAAGVDPAGIVLAQCGASVHEINTALQTYVNRALPTSGASDGQTIAGAISTGTHGAAVKVGAMQDNVKGLHIVTSSSDEVWIEPGQKVLSDSYFAQIMPGAKRINDDDVFNATIVSFGNFGLIHAVLLGCEPLYLLSIYQKTVKWNDIKQCLNGPGNYNVIGLDPDPHHVEVVVNPFNIDQTIAMVMYKSPATTPPTLIVPPGAAYGPGADVLSLISGISGSIPVAIPAAMKFLGKTINGNYPDRHGESNYPGKIFTSGLGPDLTGAGLSTELGIDANETVRVADIIFDVVKATPLLGVVSFRFVKGSKATLAFTKFPQSCAIEFPSVLSNQTQKFFNALWARLEQENVNFTFHWGQCNNLTPERTRSKWGNTAVDSWIASRHKVLDTPSKRNMFSNKFLHDCGLADELPGTIV